MPLLTVYPSVINSPRLMIFKRTNRARITSAAAVLSIISSECAECKIRRKTGRKLFDKFLCNRLSLISPSYNGCVTRNGSQNRDPRLFPFYSRRIGAQRHAASLQWNRIETWSVKQQNGLLIWRWRINLDNDAVGPWTLTSGVFWG